MTPTTALLLIDAQVNMFDPANPAHGASELLDTLAGLLARARDAGAAVVLVRNCGGPDDPDQRGTSGWEIHPRLEPRAGERVLDKTTQDAFESTSLAEDLERAGARRVVVAGLQSEYCVRATSLGALSRGLEVVLVSNGHSTYDGRDRKAAEVSASINTELGARVRLVRADDVGFD